MLSCCMRRVDNWTYKHKMVLKTEAAGALFHMRPIFQGNTG
jgi:hypothetical protein